jgi:release factor glutamine methyltransferase
MFATDISIDALRIARANAATLGAAVTFIACDLATAFAPNTFDLVICNPPYVPARDTSTIQREVREHEPPVALYGGDDGLDVYRRLIPEAARLLRPGGSLIMEMSYAVTEPLRAMLANWTDLEFRADLAGLPRVAVARFAI